MQDGRRKLAYQQVGTQVKAEADRIAEHILEVALTRIRKIPVVSEEDSLTHHSVEAPECWIIDPIDGTASFVEGYSGYVTQVAYLKNARPEFAAVFAPALDKMYLAARNKGASLNGSALSVRNSGPAHVLVDNTPEPTGIAKRLYEELGLTGYVESGSLGLKACLVAEGSADVFFKDVPVQNWDLAPAQLILQEVGGWMSDASGNPIRFRGGIEHNGLIVARNRMSAQQVVDWYAKRPESG